MSGDWNPDFCNSPTDSDVYALLEAPQIPSSSRLPKHRFHQVPMDEASLAYFSDADALPHNLESFPFSALKPEPLPSSSNFEALSSDHENSSSALDSLCNSET